MIQNIKLSKEQAELATIIARRGPEFDPGQAAFTQKKYGQIPQDDGGEKIPQLTHLSGLTYKQNQNDLVADELAAMKKPKLEMQPLFFNIPTKIPASIQQFPFALPPPNFDRLEMSSMVSKQYVKQEEDEVYNPPKKYLVYSKLLPQKKEFTALKNSPRDGLKFESRFEGGNLFAVTQVGREQTYELYVTPDAPTPFHCQNFCFRAQGFQKRELYSFKVMNLSKLRPQLTIYAFIEGQYVQIGQNCCSFRANEMQKTEFFYQNLQLDKYQNGDAIKESEEYTALQKSFLTFQKGKGMKKKEIKKGTYANAMTINCYRYTFQLKFDTDMPEIFISSIFPYTYTHLLQYMEKLNQIVLDSLMIQVEVKQMCRSYYGNAIPITKIFLKSDEGKDAIVVVGRVAPSDSASTIMAQGFIDEMVGRMDWIFEDQIKAAQEQNKDLLVQQLKQQFQRHKQNRYNLLCRYSIFVVPMINVDAAMIGATRLNSFGSDLNIQFREVANYKNPAVLFIQNVVKYFQQLKMNIGYFFDLKTQKKANAVRFDSNTFDTFEKLRLQIWDIIGRAGVIPACELPFFENMENKDIKDYYDDRRTKKELTRQIRTSLLEFLQTNKYFSEFAEFAPLKSWDLFNFAQSTFTAPNEKKVNTARATYYQEFGARSFTVVAPTMFSTKEHIIVGREIVKFIMNRFDEDGDILKKETQRLQEEYCEWVEAALLQQFSAGRLKAVDESKFSKEQLSKLPEKLKYYSCQEQDMKPKQVLGQAQSTEIEPQYQDFRVINEKTQVRPALNVNGDAMNISDSDDSECDPDAGSGLAKKQTAEEAQELADKIGRIRFMFEQAYPDRSRTASAGSRKSSANRAKSAKKK